MIPVLIYYGSPIFQPSLQVVYTHIPQEIPLTTFPSQMMMVPSNSIQSLDATEKPKGFQKINQYCNSKKERIRLESDEESQLKAEQKVVKRAQNPLRNIYTNLTNLVLNSIICKKKVNNLLQKIDPTMVGDRLIKFYKYIKDLKTYFCSYFNLQKVRKLFSGNSIPNFNKDFHRILKIAAKYILQQKIPVCLLTSKKLSSNLRTQHFHSRRVLLSIVKQKPIPNQSQ